MPEVLDVAVVGGGIAGLAAAYEVTKRGGSVRVLERTGRTGGVILTERFDGWTVDAGPDSLLTQKPAAVGLARELGLGDRLHPTKTPRTSFVLRGGRLYPLVEGSFLGFPLSASALARSPLFSWPGKIRMALEPLVPKRTDPSEESIGAFVRRRFGSEAADYLADPLLAGIHAGDAERLSARALFPRLVAAEATSGSVLRAFRKLRAAPSPDGAFMSLPGGTGELAEAVAAALPAGTIRLHTGVRSLGRDGVFVLETDGGDLVRATSVILAVPAYVAARLLGEVAPAAAALAAGVRYASTATVALGYRRSQVSHPLNGTGFVVPKVEGSPLLAGTWVSAKWPHRAPDGHVLMRAFFGGGRDPKRLEQSDDELRTLAHANMAALTGITGDPLFSRVYRWTDRSPQYDVGHLDRVAAIDRVLAGVQGLFLAGSGFRAIGIPDCIADGRAMGASAMDTTRQAAEH
ncbi:MAG: protoporphyrinogen oxidase [Vicinamibacterales bacterium]